MRREQPGSNCGLKNFARRPTVKPLSANRRNNDTSLQKSLKLSRNGERSRGALDPVRMKGNLGNLGEINVGNPPPCA